MQFLNKKREILTSLVEKPRTPTWQITVPLFVLLGFLPIRILTLLCVDPIHRDIVFFTGLGLLSFFAFFMSRAVPYLLNNKVVQLLFFTFLSIENFIYSSSSRLEAFYLSLSTCSFILFVPMSFLFYFGCSQLTWYLFVYIIAFTCYRLRTFFVVPSENLVVDMIENGYLKRLDKVEDFNWSIVVSNMNKVSESLYKLPVENRLGSRLTNRPMKAVGVRYVSSWFSRLIGGMAESAGANFGRQVIESVKKDPATKAGVSVGSMFGGWFLHRELNTKEEGVRVERLRVEGDLVVNRAKVEVDRMNAEANLKNAKTYEMQVEVEKTYLQQNKPSSGWYFWGKREPATAPAIMSVDPKASVTKTKALSVWEESLFYKAKGYTLEFLYWFL